MRNQPESVYALLINANPVPDPEMANEILDRRRLHLSVVDNDVHKTQTKQKSRELGMKSPRRLRIAPVLAGSVALITLVAALVASRDSVTDAPVADQPGGSTAAEALVVDNWVLADLGDSLQFDRDAGTYELIDGVGNLVSSGEFLTDGRHLRLVSLEGWWCVGFTTTFQVAFDGPDNATLELELPECPILVDEPAWKAERMVLTGG